MGATYRVTAPYITLKIMDPVAGTPTMLGFYEGAHVAGDRVEAQSLRRHLDRGWIEEFDQVDAETPDDQSDGDPGTPPPAGGDVVDHVPDGKVEDVLAWVGDDQERAARALVAEQNRDKPRSTLVDQLTMLANLSS